MLGGHADDLIAPQARALEHVGLVDRRHLAPARDGRLEGDLGNAADLLPAVGAGVVGRITLAPALAEVDAARELAHHQQVGALDALGAQRAALVQRRDGLDRPQVCEQPHPGAQRQQGLLGAGVVGVGGVPLGTAHGSQQHGVGCLTGLQHAVRQWLAVGVDGASANGVRLPVDLDAVELRDVIDQATGLPHHLGSDAVTRQQYDLDLAHWRSFRGLGPA